MIPIFIGYDRRETIAWHVLAASIIHRTKSAVAISPIGNSNLDPVLWKRPMGPFDSTEFSSARFMVPALCDYRGWAIFMDADMVCGEDIGELWAQRDNRYALMCVKHQHRPTEGTKFLGATQTSYERKNWSSLMLMNCGHPAMCELTPEYVNSAPGLDLHRFSWLHDSELIGEIKGAWNVLSTEESGKPGCFQHPEIDVSPQTVKLLHLTRGGPWHGCHYAGAPLWIGELGQVFLGDNPKAEGSAVIDDKGGLNVTVRYAKTASL